MQGATSYWLDIRIVAPDSFEPHNEPYEPETGEGESLVNHRVSFEAVDDPTSWLTSEAATSRLTVRHLNGV